MRRLPRQLLLQREDGAGSERGGGSQGKVGVGAMRGVAVANALGVDSPFVLCNRKQAGFFE